VRKVKVNTALDTSDGYNLHFFGLIPYVPMGLTFSFEGRAIMAHFGGAGPGLHRLTGTVKHKFVAIAQENHDCGFWILDHTVPPYPINQYEASIWPHTSRKFAFAASTVKMEGEPTGCAATGAETYPLMTCGDLATAPTAFAGSNSANTVHVGMTEGDFIFGWLGILVSVAIDIVFFALSLAIEIPLKIFEAVMGFLTSIFGKFFPIADIKKFLAGFVAGVVLSIARWYAEGQKGPIVIELPPRNPRDPDEPRVIISFDPATGRPKWEEKPRSPVRVPKVPHVSSPATPAPEQSGPQTEGADDWGHSLVPPDERPGWGYDGERGWALA